MFWVSPCCTQAENDSPKNENHSSLKSESEAKELKVHKENVHSNADEEASVRLALELMRQEVGINIPMIWRMFRFLYPDTLRIVLLLFIFRAGRCIESCRCLQIAWAWREFSTI